MEARVVDISTPAAISAKNRNARRMEWFGYSIANSVASGLALMVYVARTAPIREIRGIHKQQNARTKTNRGSNEQI
jgi:hypothetical protein